MLERDTWVLTRGRISNEMTRVMMGHRLRLGKSVGEPR